MVVNVLGKKIEEAQELLSRALSHSTLVCFDRFGSAGRNIFSGAYPIQIFRPDLTVSYYAPWKSCQPKVSLTCESKTHRRDAQLKHHYVQFLWTEIEKVFETFDRPPAIAAWYQTPELKELTKRFGGKILAIPEPTRQILEDKSRLNSLLKNAGVDPSFLIESISIESGTSLPSYHEMVSRFELPFVVQCNSSGGRGTIFVFQPSDYEKAARLLGPRRISRFISGFSANTTVLTAPSHKDRCRVYVDLPSHKAIHIPEVGIGETKGAGNDWTIPFRKVELAGIIDAAVKIGEYAYRTYGLVGLWGFDSIWSDKGLVINEINCRNQGTTEVSSINQLLGDFLPLLAAHYTILLGEEVIWLCSPDEFNDKTLNRASQPLKISPFYLKIRNREKFPLKNDLNFSGSGIYRFTNSQKLEWLREDCHTLSANFDQGEVLIANAPLSDTICMPGAELCTLEGVAQNHSIFSSPHTLSETAKKLVNAVFCQFVPCENQGVRVW